MLPDRRVCDRIGVHDDIHVHRFDLVELAVVNCLGEAPRVGNPCGVFDNEERTDDGFDAARQMIRDGAEVVSHADDEWCWDSGLICCCCCSFLCFFRLFGFHFVHLFSAFEWLFDVNICARAPWAFHRFSLFSGFLVRTPTTPTTTTTSTPFVIEILIVMFAIQVVESFCRVVLLLIERSCVYAVLRGCSHMYVLH